MTYLPLSETTIPQTPRRRISSPFPEHSTPPLLPLSPLLTPRNLPRCSVTHLFASVERRIARRDTFQGRNRAPRAMITIPPWNRPHFSRFIVILSTRPKEGRKDSIRDTVHLDSSLRSVTSLRIWSNRAKGGWPINYRLNKAWRQILWLISGITEEASRS